MLHQVGTISVYLVLTVLVLSVVTLLINREKIVSPIKELSYYLYWNLAIEISARILMELNINNLPLLHLYTLGELIFWSFFYWKVLRLNSIQRKTFLITTGLTASLVLINSIFIQEITGFNSNAKTLVNVLLISYSVIFLYQLLHLTNVERKKHRFSGLINSAVLIYYSGSLMIFMFSNYLYQYLEDDSAFWVFNVLLNLLFQILIFIALWKVFRNKTSSSSLH